MISCFNNTYRILLASTSPRRIELLHQLGLQFELINNKSVDETYPGNLKNEDVAMFIAEKKASVHKLLNDNDLLITADTIVCIEDKILGKPSSYEDAFSMLSCLRSKTHSVITGVSLKTKTKTKTFFSKTLVSFGNYSDDDINYYIDNYKPFDKAGAYGIQEWIGLIAVERIEGSYFNVMGLPIQRLYTELVNF